jgi:hypothetical protein
MELQVEWMNKDFLKAKMVEFPRNVIAGHDVLPSAPLLPARTPIRLLERLSGTICRDTT